MNRRAQLRIIAPDASPEEAAAVAAAVERFLRDRAPVLVETPAGPAPSPWRQAALREGVMRRPQPPAPWD